MDLGIDGKVVFCTGGSKGMGREAAHLLAAEGCKVAVIARTPANVDDAVASIEAAGGTAIGIYADISVEADVKRAVAECTAAFGPPLIVIGQTLHNVPADFADIDDNQHFLDSFNAYTMSTIYLLQAVLPAMKSAGWGRFVHIGSATAKEPVGLIHHVIANTTRPSTIGLLKTVSDEYAKYGITVNTIAPGWILTQNAADYVENQLGLTDDESIGKWAGDVAGIPAARFGRPEEIASTVVYLCSQGAGYVNGCWIEVDGGHHRSAF